MALEAACWWTDSVCSACYTLPGYSRITGIPGADLTDSEDCAVAAGSAQPVASAGQRKLTRPGGPSASRSAAHYQVAAR